MQDAALNADATGAVARRRRVLLLAAAITPLMRWLVLRFSVPIGEPWRRACDGCETPFPPAGPMWSPVLPTARCGQCGRRLGAPPYAVEAMLIAAVAIAVWAAPSAAVAGAAFWWLLCAVVLLFVDLRVHRLPDAVTTTATLGVLALLAANAVAADRWDGFIRAALTAAGFGAAFLVVAVVLGRRGIGLGDVKLVVSLAALLGWWGPGAVFAALFLAFGGSGVVGGALLATRRVSRGGHIPMAPFFVTGTVAVLLLLGWTTR